MSLTNKHLSSLKSMVQCFSCYFKGVLSSSSDRKMTLHNVTMCMLSVCYTMMHRYKCLKRPFSVIMYLPLQASTSLQHHSLDTSAVRLSYKLGKQMKLSECPNVRGSVWVWVCSPYSCIFFFTSCFCVLEVLVYISCFSGTNDWEMVESENEQAEDHIPSKRRGPLPEKAYLAFKGNGRWCSFHVN